MPKPERTRAGTRVSGLTSPLPSCSWQSLAVFSLSKLSRLHNLVECAEVQGLFQNLCFVRAKETRGQQEESQEEAPSPERSGANASHVRGAQF